MSNKQNTSFMGLWKRKYSLWLYTAVWTSDRFGPFSVIRCVKQLPGESLQQTLRGQTDRWIDGHANVDSALDADEEYILRRFWGFFVGIANILTHPSLMGVESMDSHRTSLNAFRKWFVPLSCREPLTLYEGGCEEHRWKVCPCNFCNNFSHIQILL